MLGKRFDISYASFVLSEAVGPPIRIAIGYKFNPVI
tara:strand:- start:353 stop:460 length:108 start_codon:yes stop_codon:yes gene_type:complete